MRQLKFTKGHGTKNDFVIFSDRTGVCSLTAAEVRFLCDRRAGIGADGVLRAIKAAHVPEWDGDPDLWFMDYRNADGSVAEMCGNGLRVFAKYLQESDLVAQEDLTIATRAGARRVDLRQPEGQVRAEIGPVRVLPDSVEVSMGGRVGPAAAVDAGNPHAVTFLAEGESLAGLDLSAPPQWRPEAAFPAGVNAEFVEVLGPRWLGMRVFERGVGETQSCGTGTVAVAAAAAAREGVAAGSWRIRVPGGNLAVDLTPETSWLTGPAVIVARGEVMIPEHRD